MIELHEAQVNIGSSNKRYKVWRAGRRTGKTIYAGEEIKGTSVLGSHFSKEARVLYIATTQGQARDIIWSHLKKEYADSGASLNGTRLEIDCPTDTKGKRGYVKLIGWESIDRVRGQSFDLIVIDEVDSIPGFLVEFQETVKPLVLDRKGKIIFIGTPKDSNPNLQSLENTYKNDSEWAFFHNSSYDNPFLDKEEIDKEREALSLQSFRQEWLAEYGDGDVRLFDPVAVEDMFRITLTDNQEGEYYVVDPAGDGADKTASGRWKGFEVWLDEQSGLSSDAIEEDLLLKEITYSIPRQNLMLDGVGLGDSIGDRQRLKGMTVFKGSFAPISTDRDISKVGTKRLKDLGRTQSDFLNLRAQTYFALARLVSDRKIKVNCTVQQAEEIKRELFATVEMEGKNKKQLIPKDDIKRIVGQSPDKSDVLAMRMYYYLMDSVVDVEEDTDLSSFNNDIFEEEGSNL